MAQRFGWGRVFGLALLAALFGLRVWDPAALQIAKPHVPAARPVVIVDIDEASLNTLGRWPWPRKGDTRKALAPKASFATLGRDPNPYLIE